ncbi:YdeI/OmpD-associated family protein [Botryobacter ruber]|uniref:YdeI/OmpD-associated family protein n=1 Tax=Botryobacter ruber TaxID=2171629 RepID=UPI000E0ABCC8|nr:YdeI/OmpD-associated family protein [Botryobacter ruber]
MQNTDPRITAYIEKAEPFAQPILHHLRQLVHQACPDITETIKWGFPHFEFKGIVCSMAAFKKHCAFTFFKASLLTDPYQLLAVADRASMGHLGQLKSPADLPSDEIMLQYIAEAVKLNQDNVKAPSKAKAGAKQELVVPMYFQEALEQNGQAKAAFENFSYSHRKEYVSWLTEAKTDATREKRMATALEWLAEGKSRNWKYEKAKA